MGRWMAQWKRHAFVVQLEDLSSNPQQQLLKKQKTKQNSCGYICKTEPHCYGFKDRIAGILWETLSQGNRRVVVEKDTWCLPLTSTCMHMHSHTCVLNAHTDTNTCALPPPPCSLLRWSITFWHLGVCILREHNFSYNNISTLNNRESV